MKTFLTMAAVAAMAVPSAAAPMIETGPDALSPVARHWVRQNQIRQQRMDAKSEMPRLLTDAMKKSPEASVRLFGMNSFKTMEGPDGTTWYCRGDMVYDTVRYEHFEELNLKEFTYTIYDNTFTEVGKIHDKIRLNEDKGDRRVAELDVCYPITQKFFNYDTKYEVILGYITQTQNQGSNNMYTRVYSLGGEKDEEGFDKTVWSLDGQVIANAVNAATSSFDENWYLTFSSEEVGKLDGTLQEYLDTYKMVLSTYTKASYSSGGAPKLIDETKIKMVCMPGNQQDSPAMFTFSRDGRAYFLFQSYDKSYFVDPTGMGGDDLSPDNNLTVDLFSAGNMEQAFKKETTFSIPVSQEGLPSDFSGSFYAIGALDYENDIIPTADGKFNFIVGRLNYEKLLDDATVNSYYLYNDEGKVVNTIAEYCAYTQMLSDIPGKDRQIMVVRTDGKGATYQCIDIPSGNIATEINAAYSSSNTLTTSFDRVLTADGIRYASKVSGAEVKEDGHAYDKVAWYGTDGQLIRTDELDLGANIGLAEIYLHSSVLNPYFYNTDDDYEYMYLVKRTVGTDIQEELMICSTSGQTLLHLTPDASKGTLNTISVIPDELRNRLMLTYNSNGNFNVDYYDLPLTKFVGGDGTASSPYLIATPGDFQEIKGDLTAHYRLTADIDMAGFDFRTIPGKFSGSLDGNGKRISGLDLTSPIFNEIAGGSVRDLTLMAPHVTGDAVIASSGNVATAENISIFGLDASGENEGYFGSIFAQTTGETVIKGCNVTGVINIPEASVGGLVGRARDGINIAACSFSGAIQGRQQVGGIVGYLQASSGSVADCHADADIVALNTIGGIVGSSNRAPVTRCYAEGSLKATGPSSKWEDYGPCAGGIIGTLAAPSDDQTRAEAVSPLSKCLVGIKSIQGYESNPESTPDYATQRTTLHRIVGKSRINFEPEITGYTPDWEPIYGDPVAETEIAGNYAFADLQATDKGDKTTDGADVDKYDIEADWLTSNLGFKFGTTADAPWNKDSDTDPALWHEIAVVAVNPQIAVTENETFTVAVYFAGREQLSEEDVLGQLTMDYPEDLFEMAEGYTYAANRLTVPFKALKEGKGNISICGATSEVTVSKDWSGVEEVIDRNEVAVSVRDGFAVAEGCALRVFSTTGAAVAQGTSRIDLRSLPAGIYIIVATDSEGRTSSIKTIR